MTLRGTVHAALLLGSWSAAAAAPAADTPCADPAPPRVQALEPLAAPPAVAYPELTYHAAPRPLAPDAVTEDWPGFLGPRRDGRSRETRLERALPESGPRLVWEMRCGDGYAAPALAQGRVVFTHRVGSQAHVDCLDAESGRRFWRFSYPCEYRGRYISDSGPRSTPSIADGLVYVHGVEGRLHCLELATGRVLWARDLKQEFGLSDDFFGVVSSPLIVGELLVQNIGAPDGPSVIALDRRDGRVVWGAGKDWGPSCASPVRARVRERELLFVLAGGDSRPPTGGLMVLDAASGELVSRYEFRSRTYESVNAASPVVAGERVFVSASYGTGSACLALAADGSFTELWKNRHFGLQFSNPVFHDGYLYAIDGTSDRAGALVCIDPERGEERSRTDLDWEEDVLSKGERKTRSASVGEGSILFADGDFLCLGDGGHLLWLQVSPDGAKVLARTSLFQANESWTPLALSRGLLYVRQNRPERFGEAPRRLLCYDLRAGGP